MTLSSILIPALTAMVTSSVGAVVLLTKVTQLNRRFQAGSTGLCAGVMLGAAVFGLMLPAVAVASQARTVYMMASVMAGALLMELLHRVLPHEHLTKGHEGPASRGLHRTILIVLAIAFHNLPEGLSLGIGYIQPDPAASRSLLLGIGAQNIPEGLLVAVGLIAMGASRAGAFLGVLICAAIEAVGAVIGSMGGLRLASLLPWTLLACAGAMIYVVSQEMIPESHREGRETLATFALLLGFVGMFWLSLVAA